MDAAEVPYKKDNVYEDISGLTIGEFESTFEQHLVQRPEDMSIHVGEPGRQLLYGSDWPLVRMGPYVKLLENLTLPAEQKEAIAWKTSARLFRIDIDAMPKAAPRPSRGALRRGAGVTRLRGQSSQGGEAEPALERTTA